MGNTNRNMVSRCFMAVAGLLGFNKVTPNTHIGVHNDPIPGFARSSRSAKISHDTKPFGYKAEQKAARKAQRLARRTERKNRK